MYCLAALRPLDTKERRLAEDNFGPRTGKVTVVCGFDLRRAREWMQESKISYYSIRSITSVVSSSLFLRCSLGGAAKKGEEKKA